MDKVKKWIRNLSVRKTIILYLSVSLLVCFLLSAFIGNAASDIQEYIWEKYTDEEDFETVLEIENKGYLAQIPRPAASEMSRLDHTISEICDFQQTYAVLILSVAGSCVAVFLFYRNKLKRPLGELGLASGRIAENDLDFRITYENGDEIGHLCREFEKMRSQLEENNRKMNSLEQRELRADEITKEQLGTDIRAELDILGKEKRICLSVQGEEEIFRGDREVILEVLENLLSNALRYARDKIDVTVSLSAQELSLSVRDDGIGFQEEGEKITSAFHQQNIKDSLTHTGMGMYISRLYCEKHGGRLILENEESGGASVTAVFRRIA
ncbi:MAG TPA: HAMP domain-containing protein [Candidatus Mediterraneibacter stercoripullorum]|nr:HAMP domain-containing protein [Candidatus Mediterraneibacter stercoripullorum]